MTRTAVDKHGRWPVVVSNGRVYDAATWPLLAHRERNSLPLEAVTLEDAR